MKTGLVGTILSVLCCFTLLLAVLLGIIGLSSITGYLDYVLLPVFAVFVLVTFYALWKKKKI